MPYESPHSPCTCKAFCSYGLGRFLLSCLNRHFALSSSSPSSHGALRPFLGYPPGFSVSFSPWYLHYKVEARGQSHFPERRVGVDGVHVNVDAPIALAPMLSTILYLLETQERSGGAGLAGRLSQLCWNLLCGQLSPSNSTIEHNQDYLNLENSQSRSYPSLITAIDDISLKI